MGAASSSDNDGLIDYLANNGYLDCKSVELAFRLVDRGRFVAEEFRREAYRDAPFKAPDGVPGQVHLSAPCIYSSVLTNLDIQNGHSFLNIGSGTGYLSTVAGFLLGDKGVNHGVEVHSNLVEYANDRLAETLRLPEINTMEWSKPIFFHGNGLRIFEESNESYDRIYCGAAIEESDVPDVARLLKMDGLLVAPIDDALQVIKKTPTGLSRRSFSTVSFATLIPPQEDSSPCVLPSIRNPLTLRQFCRAIIRYSLREKAQAIAPTEIRLISRFSTCADVIEHRRRVDGAAGEDADQATAEGRPTPTLMFHVGVRGQPVREVNVAFPNVQLRRDREGEDEVVADEDSRQESAGGSGSGVHQASDIEGERAGHSEALGAAPATSEVQIVEQPEREDGEAERREARMMRSLAATTRLSQRIRAAETRRALDRRMGARPDRPLAQQQAEPEHPQAVHPGNPLPATGLRRRWRLITAMLGEDDPEAQQELLDMGLVTRAELDELVNERQRDEYPRHPVIRIRRERPNRPQQNIGVEDELLMSMQQAHEAVDETVVAEGGAVNPIEINQVERAATEAVTASPKLDAQGEDVLVKGSGNTRDQNATNTVQSSSLSTQFGMDNGIAVGQEENCGSEEDEETRRHIGEETSEANEREESLEDSEREREGEVSSAETEDTRADEEETDSESDNSSFVDSSDDHSDFPTQGHEEVLTAEEHFRRLTGNPRPPTQEETIRHIEESFDRLRASFDTQSGTTVRGERRRRSRADSPRAKRRRMQRQRQMATIKECSNLFNHLLSHLRLPYHLKTYIKFGVPLVPPTTQN